MGWIMFGLFLGMCCVGLVLLYLGLTEAENTQGTDWGILMDDAE